MAVPCPRCSNAEAEVPLSPGAGALGEAVCASCGGRLLEEAAVQRVIIEEHGIGRETLRDLAGHFGRAALRCAGCGQRMHPIRLREVPLDLCTGCGAVWLDAGELTRLTEGRWAEVAGPASPLPEAPTEVVAPPTAPQGWAVLLDDDRPEAERLVTAFARARFRTAQDARTAALRGHGVIADRIPADDAEQLRAALVGEGLPARVLDAALLELPAAVRTKQLGFDPAGLHVADALGRSNLVAWHRLRALAVGLVKLAEAETQLVAPEPGEAAAYGSQAMGSMPAPKRVRTVMVERDDVLVDLLVEDDEGRRGRVRITRSGVILRHLGGQSRDAAFRALVQELVVRAPAGAALSRGASLVRSRDEPWLRYRALRDFELAQRWAVARALLGLGAPP